jgi:hypothetical protein
MAYVLDSSPKINNITITAYGLWQKMTGTEYTSDILLYTRTGSKIYHFFRQSTSFFVTLGEASERLWLYASF